MPDQYRYLANITLCEVIECIDDIEVMCDHCSLDKEGSFMVRSREEFEEEIMAATTRLYRASPPKSMEPWLHLDLTTAQVKTLAVLSDSEPATIGEAAETLGITLPTASHLVDKLVRAGFAERHEDPIDRRRTVARPTARGMELIRSLREFSAGYLRACIGRMSDADLAALAQGMDGLARAADELKNDPAWSRESTPHKEPVHR
jgi:DNA-binding MarR family transcriptional regulator